METSSTDWIFDQSINPTDYEGFVYLITHIATGRMYVGKKSTWVYKKQKKHKESKWRDYWSSSQLVMKLVEDEGKEAFKREILSWHSTRKDLTYAEVEEQIRRDVLKARFPSGERMYFNGNILNRFFVPPDVISEETRKKLSQSLSNRVLTQEHKDAIGQAHKGRIISLEQRRKASENRRRELALYGPRPHTPESRAKIGKGNTKISDERKATLADRIAAGETLETLAAEFGVERECVRRAVKAAGIEYRHPRFRKK